MKYDSLCTVSFWTIQADTDNSGTIDYGEFIAAMLHINKIQKEDHMYAAFSYFDKDGSGYITQDELQQACEKFGWSDVPIEEIIHEVDQDHVRLLCYYNHSASNPPVYCNIYEHLTFLYHSSFFSRMDA